MFPTSHVAARVNVIIKWVPRVVCLWTLKPCSVTLSVTSTRQAHRTSFAFGWKRFVLNKEMTGFFCRRENRYPSIYFIPHPIRHVHDASVRSMQAPRLPHNCFAAMTKEPLFHAQVSTILQSNFSTQWATSLGVVRCVG